MGWVKKVSESFAFGLDPGMDYKYLRWTKSHNKEREICKYYEWNPEPTNCVGNGRGCKTKQYRENEKVSSQILSGTIKPFLEYKDFRFFGIGGIGIEVEDTEDANLAVTGGLGLQYYFSKNLGLTMSAQEVYSNPTGKYERWDLYLANVLYRF